MITRQAISVIGRGAPGLLAGAVRYAQAVGRATDETFYAA